MLKPGIKEVFVTRVTRRGGGREDKQKMAVYIFSSNKRKTMNWRKN